MVLLASDGHFGPDTDYDLKDGFSDVGSEGSGGAASSSSSSSSSSDD